MKRVKSSGAANKKRRVLRAQEQEWNHGALLKFLNTSSPALGDDEQILLSSGDEPANDSKSMEKATVPGDAEIA